MADRQSLTAAGNYSENNNSDLGPAEKKLGNLDLPVNQSKNGQQNSFDSLTQLNSLDNSAYEQLCSVYSEPLEKLSESFRPVHECSSPFFRSRVEDYCDEFSKFFQLLHGGNLQVIASSHNFTQELLIQRGIEYKATERWGVVPKNNQDEGSVYFRSTNEKVSFVDRKAEWSMLIQARLPFVIKLLVENEKSIEMVLN